ncbi:MMPL family transporter [Paractinoplanes brasiliensis]|uniref:RND superfamily putative drug exporter n=1 Tax=Paractinoplanes brasiliensis TaxID=52695 RepID=A0A4R6JUA3_9ACTN|nr:MMPL family transporter [Actinoplanes brasiliensis]TDO39061.1 RND superfamily putative drug exporter [Actinoplanes brasiliensis]GID30239.1 membrane protein [Actinoplanes brasiliensis]
MENPGEVKGIAARAALWSARHRTLAILGWIAFVIAVTVLSGQFGTVEATGADQGHGDSRKADRIVEAAGFPERPAGEMVIVQNRAGDDRTAAVADVTAGLKKTKDVIDVQKPIVSPDGRSSLVTFAIAGDAEDASERVQPSLDTVARVQAAHPDLYIAQGGDASGDKLIGDKLDQGLNTLGLLSIPVTLGILLVAFGAVVAALLPVLLAIMAVVAAMGLLAFASHLAPTVDTTAHVMLLVGLAVGVDYCLFYIRRERDERRNGADPHRALVIAAQTSGRSIWISGLTVIVAMAGMFLTYDTTFVSFAVGTILVVATAVLGSLTVLPALLSALGDRVDAIKIPGLYRRRSDGRLWNGFLRLVLAKPLISAVLAVGALAVLAAPMLDLKTKAEGIEDLPATAPIVQAYKAVDEAFPSETAPVEVVVEAPSVRTPAFEAAVARLRAEVEASDGRLAGPVETRINPAGTVAVVSFGMADDADLTRLRETIVPAAFGTFTALVTGPAAGEADFHARLDASMPWVFGFVLGLAFLLLLVSFRSVVVAITGVVLNLFSVAAAYGMLVFVFQYGHFESLLDFQAADGIVNWMPLFLFIILFGLSMDYHVFVLSRIREGHDRGLPTKVAVREGIGRTAGVITSAAVVMVAVFALFATLPLASTKQLGIGLAAAVLLDATIIRAVLLPAVMALLGEKNWWLPRWLGWLPQIAHEPPAPVVTDRDDREPELAAV